MTALPVFLISFHLLALQIVWMQALAYAQGHHLAYVVVSIALLGFGAGGSALTLFSARGVRPLLRLCVPGLLLCAASTAWVPRIAHPLLAGLEMDLLLHARSQWTRLAGLVGTVFLPFFFGAISLSAVLAARSEKVGGLYAANLLGSAFGAAGSLALLHAALPEQVMAGLALVPLLAAWTARAGKWPMVAGTLAVAMGLAAAPTLPRSPYKALSYALQLPRAQREGPVPHSLGRVDVVRAPTLRYAPDLSLRFAGAVPSPPQAFVDGEDAGPLLAPSDPQSRILQETPRALPFVAGSLGTVLCLSPGGTPLLHLAAAHAARVVAVEPHSRMARLVEPLVDSRRVQLRRSDPRLFLARSTMPPVDAIIFPERGLFGGPVGLHALGEDSLFTVEAFRLAWNKLSPDGRLAFNVWLDAPLRHVPRVLDLIAQTLKAEGIAQPGRHVVAVRGWSSITILVCRAPIGVQRIEDIAAFAEDKGFDVVWPPNDAVRFLDSLGMGLDAAVAALLGAHSEAFLNDYPFDVRAPTDDKPFFNQFLRLDRRNADLEYLSAAERGIHFLLALLAVVGVATLLLVILPLWPLRASLRLAPATPIYFAGLGAGFMFFEMALIRRMTLLWGNPVAGAAAVVASLLCGMGVGSVLSRRLPMAPVVLVGVPLVAAAVQAFLLAAFDAHMESLMQAAVVVRCAGLAMLLFLCAIPFGIPFPMGLRRLALRAPEQIPWACGIDGALAVLAAPMAALLAFRWGYSSLALAAACAYGCAALGALGDFAGRAIRARNSRGLPP